MSEPHHRNNYLRTWSTLISNSTTLFFGTINVYPDVGLGVVGTYTFTYSPFMSLLLSHQVPVINAKYSPAIGNSIKTALLNAGCT